jgi:uncharacterized protein YlaI
MNEALTPIKSEEAGSWDSSQGKLCDRSLQTCQQPSCAQQLAESAETRCSQRFSFHPIAQKNFCIRKNQAGEMSYIMSLNLPYTQDFWNELYGELS